MDFVGFQMIFLTIIFALVSCQKSSCPGQTAAHSSAETTTCECSKLEECLVGRQKQIEQFQDDCRKSCGTLIGENVTEILDCMSSYEANKRNQKLEMEKCLHDLTGKPCVGSRTDKPYTLMINLTSQPTPAADSPVYLANKQTLASIKNHPLLNPYRKCYKTCMKRSPIYVQPTTVGEKVTRNPSCFEQSGCNLPRTASVDKALKKVAKNNCALQTKSDKTALKITLAECLQKAFSNRSNSAPTGSTAACEKPHSDEL